jgi:hypothetical protein
MVLTSLRAAPRLQACSASAHGIVNLQAADGMQLSVGDQTPHCTSCQAQASESTACQKRQLQSAHENSTAAASSQQFSCRDCSNDVRPTHNAPHARPKLVLHMDGRHTTISAELAAINMSSTEVAAVHHLLNKTLKG